MNYAKIPTERPNPRTRYLDTLTVPQILQCISSEDRQAARAVLNEKRSIEKTAYAIEKTLRSRKRLFFVGAGTSGRLGAMEAAECPPTFHTKPGQIQAIIAGGKPAVFKSREGAEDDAVRGARETGRKARRGDFIIGIAASGMTPFVLAALKKAQDMGCSTALVTCNPAWKVQSKGLRPLIVICLHTGPEVIAGSTRMKAGTATKMVLNMITTAAMVRLGKVYQNRMVDMELKSAKLKDRAARMVCELAGVSKTRALKALHLSKGRVKTAIVMAKKNVSYSQAMKLLKTHQGFLRKALR